MKLVEAHSIVKQMHQAVFTTNDGAACLGVRKDTASQILGRLADAGHIVRVKRGLWLFPDGFDPLLLPEHLTSPFPSYISLQSALYYHGMISQIPEITYSVSPTRTRTFKTPIGTFSVHHVKPSFFLGYTPVGEQGIKMASPEKALLDFLYLGPAKTNLFRSLPELELTSGFSIRTAQKIIRSIDSNRRRALVEKEFQIVMENL